MPVLIAIQQDTEQLGKLLAKLKLRLRTAPEHSVKLILDLLNRGVCCLYHFRLCP
jgi:hypothetical protein